MKRQKRQKQIESKYSCLLDHIIQHYGGPTQCAEFINAYWEMPDYMSGSILAMARSRGILPLRYCLNVSRALKCSPYALNFMDVSEFDFKKEVTWEEAIDSCKCLDEYYKEKVRNFKKPA
jgi:hypothetical protein